MNEETKKEEWENSYEEKKTIFSFHTRNLLNSSVGMLEKKLILMSLLIYIQVMVKYELLTLAVV